MAVERLRRYGLFKEKENTDRCVFEVKYTTRGDGWHQCRNGRGHGPDKLYCKIHAKIVEADNGL